MDYHIHPDYSIDAVGTVEEYCEAALQRNLAEICFTTHYDNNPHSDGFARFIRINGENKATSVKNLAAYVEDVRTFAEVYYTKGLSVKLGLEFGWYENCEEEVTELKERYDFDYLLCGIHEIDNICFCARSTYEKCFNNLTIDEVAKKYFEQVKRAAETKLFDTIAHLNYYYKYARKYYGDAVDNSSNPYLHDIFQSLIQNDIALEINTSGIRQGIDQYYPDIHVVNRAKSAGVKVSYLGSDAHKPEDIGFEFELATALVPDNVAGCED